MLSQNSWSRPRQTLAEERAAERRLASNLRRADDEQRP